MNPFFKINIYFLILLLYSLSIGQGRKITVSGTVIDSITGDPVPNVKIILTENISALSSGDLNALLSDTNSTTSDNSGKFSAKVSVNLTSLMLAGIFIKGKYQIKVETVTMLFNMANFSTIKIRKEVFRDVEVSGTIKDSLTDQPVPRAPVIITNTTIMYDSVYHILITDNQGRFSQEMKIGKGGIISPWILYLVEKPGYDTLMNMVPDNGKSKIDLGSIYIFNRGNTPVNDIPLTKNNVSEPEFSSVFIYSLNGKLLYSGPEANITLLRNKGLFSSHPVVVRGKYPCLNTKTKLFNVFEK